MRILIILLILGLNYTFDQQKCRVLVLEGGGDRGAYLSGAISKMVEVMPAEEVAYDVITGISAGGLIAGAMSFYEKGQEKDAADYLSKFWHTLERSDVWETWGWFYEPIFHEPALLSTAPLEKYLHKIVDGKTFKRDILIGATNIETGLLERFSLDNTTTADDAVKIMLASSAIPVVFPPREFKNKTYIDGSAASFMDVIGGINYCQDKGFFEQDIIVDIIMCFGKNVNISGSQIPKNTADSLFRVTDLIANQVLYKDLMEAQHNYEDVYFRQIITPDFFMAADVMIMFNTVQMNQMYDIGQNDAAKSWKNVTNSTQTLNLKDIKLQFLKK